MSRGTVVAAVMLLAACSDPRARPLPPVVELRFQDAVTPRSPGNLSHSVYASDADGLDFITVRIRSADSTLDADSLRVPFDLYEATETFEWTLPAGMPPGTIIRLVATATDFVGFEAADSVEFTIQTAASQRR
jgi:hypothetical protein